MKYLIVIFALITSHHFYHLHKMQTQIEYWVYGNQVTARPV
jgi:hypothetical protein